jgi:hypothetical protein
MTPERKDELRRHIDRRVDQFSLDELRNADSGTMTFKSAFPELSLREAEFAEGYFGHKMEELRAAQQTDQKPKVDQGD